MARWDVSELYHELRADEFSFIPLGRYELCSIYELVKRAYPRLCDDTYICSENCARGNQDPEWHHAVRKALGDLKRKTRRVSNSGARGYWDFT
jgi:hypothetical protein